MKILHVIPSVSQIYGGPSQAIVNIEQELVRRGFDVTIAFTRDVHEGTNCFGEYERETSKNNWLGFPKTTHFYKISFELGRWLANNVRSFDLVHIHSLFSFPSIAAAFAARKRGVPYILRPLGVLRDFGMTQRRPVLKKISMELFERRLLEAAAAVHFTSSMEMSEAKLLGLSCSGVVIPLGIEIRGRALRKEKGRNDPFVLLYLSRLDPVKNIEGLLHAFALIGQQAPKLILRIAGDGEPQYVRKVHALTQTLDISSRVEWIGHVTGDRKRELLSTASAFILPSFSESFGIAVVEALAAGLPCIVSDGVGISPEIRAVEAGIVTNTDPQELAKAILELLRSEHRHHSMQRAARGLAETHFSVEIMGARLQRLYRAICEGKPCVSTQL